MSEQEIIDAVTTKLTGKFYVGQRIRKVEGAVELNATGTIISINEDPELAVHGDYATWRHDDHGRIRHTFFWALEPI